VAERPDEPLGLWADALTVAALFAIDPAGLGGVAVHAQAGPVRDQWLACLRALLPTHAAWRRVPLHINDERLLGGLDLAATLQADRAIAQRGVLAEADGGVVILAMAERLSAATAARLAAVLDTGEVSVARDGVALVNASRIGVVALDESAQDDERLPPALTDRLAFQLDLSAIAMRDAFDADAVLPSDAADTVTQARALLPTVQANAELIEALCAAALALGIGSLRAPMLALRVARAAAALDGRELVTPQDAALAARFVLAPRATQLPAPPPADETDDTEDSSSDLDPPEDEADAGDPPPDPTANDDERRNDSEDDADEPADDSPPPESPQPTQALEDVVLEAAQAAIPAGLLAQLQLASASLAQARSSGRSGALQTGRLRGRPAGVRRGEPRGGARLNLIETLRAAAPWQKLRQHDRAPNAPQRIQVRAEDFHVTRFKQRSETTTVFVIDASGSAALHRLAEAKGAVELLLADCYVRRDRVAVLAFRGDAAELLLPPTRSLVRAKRSLAGLPGGGGTPLAAGIDAATALADAVRRGGATPVIVMLTDGRANVGRGGLRGRAAAEEHALLAARQMRAARFTSLLVDTSAQPQESARRLAGEMGAAYLPLPYAGAASLSAAVRAADPSADVGKRAGKRAGQSARP
jgi:magnesium chelatase subunit D